MIVLFGMAGSGKGTQGEALAKIYDWRWLSNGEAIRRSGKYTEIINQGKLIPDEDVIEMMGVLIDEATAAGKDVILDGYPRNIVQAQYVVEHYADRMDGALVLDVPKEELYQRLALRGRDDDKERASIDRRFKVFEENIALIVEMFERAGVPVHHVNGVGAVAEVTARLTAIIDSLPRKNTAVMQKGANHD